MLHKDLLMKLANSHNDIYWKRFRAVGNDCERCFVGEDCPHKGTRTEEGCVSAFADWLRN